MSTRATTARYEVEYVGLDGVPRIVSRHRALELALLQRDRIRHRNRDRMRSFSCSVLDSDDYEKGAVEWPES